MDLQDLSTNCDFNEPGSVVMAFIGAMNLWEIESWQASQAASEAGTPAAYLEEVNLNMSQVFQAFCTPKERKNGRQGSFQHPPQYDPQNEKIESDSIAKNGKKAFVETQREAAFGGGAYRYTLTKPADRWLIDSVKRLRDETWENAVL